MDPENHFGSGVAGVNLGVKVAVDQENQFGWAGGIINLGLETLMDQEYRSDEVLFT